MIEVSQLRPTGIVSSGTNYWLLFQESLEKYSVLNPKDHLTPRLDPTDQGLNFDSTQINNSIATSRVKQTPSYSKPSKGYVTKKVARSSEVF